jgi:hypothetical protein
MTTYRIENGVAREYFGDQPTENYRDIENDEVYQNWLKAGGVPVVEEVVVTKGKK